jgi:hypothetical protein
MQVVQLYFVALQAAICGVAAKRIEQQPFANFAIPTLLVAMVLVVGSLKPALYWQKL